MILVTHKAVFKSMHVYRKQQYHQNLTHAHTHTRLKQLLKCISSTMSPSHLLKSGKGKLAVLGSAHIFTDQFIDKEENSKLQVSC